MRVAAAYAARGSGAMAAPAANSARAAHQRHHAATRGKHKTARISIAYGASRVKHGKRRGDRRGGGKARAIA